MIYFSWSRSTFRCQSYLAFYTHSTLVVLLFHCSSRNTTQTIPHTHSLPNTDLIPLQSLTLLSPILPHTMNWWHKCNKKETWRPERAHALQKSTLWDTNDKKRLKTKQTETKLDLEAATSDWVRAKCIQICACISVPCISYRMIHFYFAHTSPPDSHLPLQSLHITLQIHSHRLILSRYTQRFDLIYSVYCLFISFFHCFLTPVLCVQNLISTRLHRMLSSWASLQWLNFSPQLKHKWLRGFHMKTLSSIFTRPISASPTRNKLGSPI